MNASYVKTNERFVITTAKTLGTGNRFLEDSKYFKKMWWNDFPAVWSLFSSSINICDGRKYPWQKSIDGKSMAIITFFVEFCWLNEWWTCGILLAIFFFNPQAHLFLIFKQIMDTGYFLFDLTWSKMYAENRVHYLLLGVCFAWTIFSTARR